MKGVFIALAIFLSVWGCASKNAFKPDEHATAPYRDMVYIPEGEFIMGSDPEDEKRGVMIGLDELPLRKVFLKSYYIDKYETTNKAYKKFVDAASYRVPADWKDNKYPEGEDDFPVAHIDWFDADVYCRWAGKRLPTEAEWEKAARGTDGRIYPWGDTFDKNKANTAESQRDRAVPVGSFPEGASPYGVMDMAGNVWEWTADWYKPYPGSAVERDIYGETHKVTRGGAGNSYRDLARTNMRFPYPSCPDTILLARFFLHPEERCIYQCYIGVRCVKDP